MEPPRPPIEAREDIRDHARKYGPAIIEFLAKTFQSEDVPYSARIVAADRLFEKGYGRPHQAEAPPEVKTIEGIVIEPFRPSTSSGNGHDEPVKLKDWRKEP